MISILKNKRIFLILIIPFGLACSKIERNGNEIKDSVITISMEGQKLNKGLKWSKIIDGMKIIQLETLDKSLIGSVSKELLLNNMTITEG